MGIPRLEKYNHQRQSCTRQLIQFTAYYVVNNGQQTHATEADTDTAFFCLGGGSLDVYVEYRRNLIAHN